MAVICRDHRLLFLLNPRTGGTAVSAALQQHCGGQQIPEHDVLAPDGSLVLQAKHNTLDDLIEHGLLTPGEIDELTVVTTVRNPFDSLYSLYLKMRDRYPPWLEERRPWIVSNPWMVRSIQFCQDHSFDQWVRHEYTRAAAATLARRRVATMHEGYAKHADVVLRFERLASDFSQLVADFSLEHGTAIAHENATPGRETSYRAAYSLRSRILVRTAYSRDLRSYGYTF
jgi:hypothetical protein